MPAVSRQAAAQPGTQTGCRSRAGATGQPETSAGRCSRFRRGSTSPAARQHNDGAGHSMRHVSKFDWAYRCLFCWPRRSAASRACRRYCQDTRAHNSPIGGDRVGRGGHEDAAPAFLDGDCYFVAVTGWMMTAYRRCQRGECSPAAVSIGHCKFIAAESVCPAHAGGPFFRAYGRTADSSRNRRQAGGT
jgi:hypothetical protein